jgi:hypothetical protein
VGAKAPAETSEQPGRDDHEPLVPARPGCDHATVAHLFASSICCAGARSAGAHSHADVPGCVFLIFHGLSMYFLPLALELMLTRSRGLVCLRQSAGVQLLEAGCDLRYLAALFGFRSLASVQRCAAVSVQRVKRVHAQFHPAEQGDGNPASTASGSGQSLIAPGAS